MARRIAAVGALLTALLVTPAIAAAEPFVHVEDVHLDRQDGRATVTARVRWHRPSADAPLNMRRGDLRLVAVSDHGHRPTLLGHRASANVGRKPVEQVSIAVEGESRLAAMRPGNRIVLTASQRRPSSGSPSDIAYVTVGQVQPYGSAQPHIGTEDCSGQAVVPGAVLDYCDLVGADLDEVLVSLHAPQAFECQVQSASTCMRRADLTGATLVRSNLSGLNLAGARLNGADLSYATLDNTSMAAVEAIDLKAVGATSDKKGQDSAANLFAARLTGANLNDTVFNGVSLAQARLDRVHARRARWTAVTAHGTDLRGADLSGLRIGDAPSDFDFADFTDARLSGRGGQADIGELQLAWAYLCHTVMAPGRRVDRDCHARIEAPLRPVPNPARSDPFVAISGASIQSPRPRPRTIRATVDWASGAGMPSGVIRVLAVDRVTGMPTLVDEQRYRGDLPETTDYVKTIDDPRLLQAMAAGNRVVLTASQYPLATPSEVTYVTVATLQRGPGRGRVGMYDCSRVPVTDEDQTLDFCDLTGAELSHARVAAKLRETSLTGATMTGGALTASPLSGAAMAGVNADGASWADVDLFAAYAPRLSLRDGRLSGAAMRAANLDEAIFDHAWFLDETTTFAGSPMRRAIFDGARLSSTDLAFANLFDASFVGASSPSTERGGSTLFMSNLTRADLTGSAWGPDEEGEVPWTWATLCDTKLPPDAGASSGDRDCPR